MKYNSRLHKWSKALALAIAIVLAILVCVVLLAKANIICSPIIARYCEYSWNIGTPDLKSVKAKLKYGGDGFSVEIYGNGNMMDLVDASNGNFYGWHRGFKNMSVGWTVTIRRAIVREGITNLSPYAFSGCTKLEDVSLPAGMNQIGEEAFAYCENLDRIQYGGTIENWKILAENSPQWDKDCGVSLVLCSDGTINL
jgi:hypothetical protein